MSEKCARCGEVGEDRRTLWMACFYAMDELDIPFEQVKVDERGFFTLRVCKTCRASWMAAIENWFNKCEPTAASPGTGVFVRKHGTNVELTEEEVEQWRKEHGCEPVRVVHDG